MPLRDSSHDAPCRPINHSSLTMLINMFLFVTGNEKIPGVQRNPSTANQKADNLRHCVSYVTAGGGDPSSVNHRGKQCPIFRKRMNRNNKYTSKKTFYRTHDEILKRNCNHTIQAYINLSETP